MSQSAALVQGPLVQQSPLAARLARVLASAADDLYDAATLDDLPQMWEDTRAVASRLLAVCEPGEPG